MEEKKVWLKFLDLSPREAELCKLFVGRDETVKVAPEGWTLLKATERRAQEYVDFQVKDSDVFVTSFPKSGTTWTQEIVWTMRNNPNLDNSRAELPLSIRTPPLGEEVVVEHHLKKFPDSAQKFLESFPDYDYSCGMWVYALGKLPSPRTIKCHLPFCILPPNILEKGKVVYLIRDPRDVCISYYHHSRIFLHDAFPGTFDQYVDAFTEDAVLFGPFWPHVHQAWTRRDHSNVHILFYEKLRKNTKEEMSKLNDFLGTKLTDEQLEKVIHYTSFEEMKKRDDHCVSPQEASSFLDLDKAKVEGGFFREGKTGGWKNVLTQQQKDKFYAWIKKKCPDNEIMDNILNA